MRQWPRCSGRPGNGLRLPFPRSGRGGPLAEERAVERESGRMDSSASVKIAGSTHWEEEKRGKDEARDRWLAQRGIAVMRIGAGAVYRNPGQVADGVILRALELIEARADRSSL